MFSGSNRNCRTRNEESSTMADDQLMLELGAFIMWVGLGSGFGGVMRYFVSGLIAHAFGENFPWGTLTVNVTGSTMIGSFAAFADAGFLAGWTHVWPLAVIGFLGSYTTVSSVSLQTLALFHQGEALRAGGNILLSVLLCLSGVTIGYMVVQAVTGNGVL
jgi:CrcB protein